MSYESARALRTALEQRLKNQATKSGSLDAALLSRLRKRVAFERFLARLKDVAPEGWLLKGGFALELRLGDMARTTKDIDVDWAIAEGESLDFLRRAAACDIGDFFRFRLERAEPRPGVDGQGQRWRLIAELDAREFEVVLVDVGVGVEPLLGSVELSLPTALDFADAHSVEIPVLRLEQHLAEKTHAYTRRYGAAAIPSSRVKDLVDIALVAATLELEAGALEFAMVELFDRRATHQLPASLPPPPVDWQRPWRELAAGLPVPGDLRNGHALAASLIDPALNERASGYWSPSSRSWENR
jgi:hypothetical protein